MAAALTLPSGRAMPRGAADLVTLVSGLPHDMQMYLDWQRRWSATARPSQLLPETDWTEAGILAGRGFGKTRVGAEWITRAAYEDPSGFDSAVIAPTYSDVKYTCFEGESGILSVLPPDLLIDHNKSDMIVKIKNIAGGVSTIRGFTAEKPERLRGPQHTRLWCFAPSTPVLMADGALRSISDVRCGDMVATRWGPRRVTAAGPSGNPSAQIIVQAVSDTDEDHITLRCTEDHPILVGGRWISAGKLAAGDRLMVVEHVGGHAAGAWQDPDRVDFTGATVTHVRPQNVELERWVPHCITVEGANEFIAGGVVVHNCDELAAWMYAQDVWDMALMGLRLGPAPQVLWTTTPKPRDIIRKLTAPQDKRIIVRGSTFDNKANLPESFFKQLEAYEGTVIGRQELYAELLDPEESGIIKRSWFKLWPAKQPLPRFDWIIMSLDTAYTEKSLNKKGDPDPTACSTWGVFEYKQSSQVMLLDCWDDHLGLPALMKRVKKELNVAYGDDEDQALIKPLFGASKPMTSGRKPDILLIEDKGSGISLRQMLAETGIEAYAYNPGRADKLSRLHIVSPVFAQRRVWLPESEKFPGKARTWCDAVVTQLCSFAGGGSIKHDDHVDACTQAIRLCLDKGLIRLIKDKPKDAGDRPPPRVVTNPYSQ